MARRRKERGAQLTLDLEAGQIPADRFRRAVNSFLDLVDAVSGEIVGGDAKIRWVVTVRGGSAHLSAMPDPLIAPAPAIQVVKAISRGMRTVERNARRPKFFSDAALASARELATVADGKQIRSATIRADETEPVVVSKRTVAHVDVILGAHVKDYGTVEGTLDSLSRRGGPHFAVYDALTDQAIRCYVPAERMEDAWKAFGRRVAVTGFIRYRKSTGQPLSVEAEDIVVFPAERDLPTADDVYGILSRA
jgi:hypothetical protein